MPTGSSFHPARIYHVLRASFSHSGDAFASFRAPRISGSRQFPARRFSAREFRARARGNVPFSRQISISPRSSLVNLA